MGHPGTPLLNFPPSVVPQVDRVCDQPCVAQNKGDSFLSGHPQSPVVWSLRPRPASCWTLLLNDAFPNRPSSAPTPDWIRAPCYNPYCGSPLLRDQGPTLALPGRSPCSLSTCCSLSVTCSHGTPPPTPSPSPPLLPLAEPVLSPRLHPRAEPTQSFPLTSCPLRWEELGGTKEGCCL